ncbi:hypothetical protein WDH52_09035 [Streptomyces sp. TRM70308]|uniref:hypothetical protein n=1 Tax=Streptomyces sp. TRM70308 TaxID=3131932 RepID=UPI003D089E23
MTERRRVFGKPGRSQAPGRSGQDDNPFAPPPEGSPDQPWRPRPGRAEGSAHAGGPGGSDGSGGSDDSGRDGGQGDGGEGSRGTWGSQWSSRQPGRQSGGFGGAAGPGGPGDDDSGAGRGPGKGGPRGMRWDPRDPAQRHARFSMLVGMWGFFFALFNIAPLALLLGALALYWGISALRGAPGVERKDTGGRDSASVAALSGTSDTARSPAPGGSGPRNPRPVTSAAVGGLVGGSLALLLVAATFALQLVYSDYYTCVDDALTTASRESCEELLPERLRPVIGEE